MAGTDGRQTFVGHDCNISVNLRLTPEIPEWSTTGPEPDPQLYNVLPMVPGGGKYTLHSKRGNYN